MHVAMKDRSTGEKLVAVAWLLIPLMVLICCVYGSFIGDLRGGLLLGFLPASFLASIAVVRAVIVEDAAARISKRVWIVVGVMALLAAIVFVGRPDPEAIKGADTILAYVMLILAFPIALLVPFVLIGIESLWPGAESIFGLAGMWLVFFVAGYAQWFIVLPWLCRKWKARRESGASPF
jgi:hypothetical protein